MAKDSTTARSGPPFCRPSPEPWQRLAHKGLALVFDKPAQARDTPDPDFGKKRREMYPREAMQDRLLRSLPLVMTVRACATCNTALRSRPIRTQARAPRSQNTSTWLMTKKRTQVKDRHG